MDHDLNKEAKNYGAFGVYVIWSIRHAVDQCLHILEVPPFLAHLSICNAFHHVLVQGQQELNTLKVENPVRRADSIWTVSDINAYTEVRTEGNLVHHVLPDNHLVSSSTQQNHNLGFAEQHLPSISFLWRI